MVWDQELGFVRVLFGFGAGDACHIKGLRVVVPLGFGF